MFFVDFYKKALPFETPLVNKLRYDLFLQLFGEQPLI